MLTLRKIATVWTVAAAMLIGSTAPATTQTTGGEEECDYELVIDHWFMSGTMPVFFWHVEVTCVTVLDDVPQ